MEQDPEPDSLFVPLIVIPCLNEAAHISGVIRQCHRAALTFGGCVVVADGGSTDGTVDIVRGFAKRFSNVFLLHNADRVQSMGINAAVEKHGGGHTHLVRIDAHCRYPDDFVAVLGREAAASGAAAVVVGMIAAGDTLLQRINASTQNAPIGNGASRHRRQGNGSFVEHGHHALIRLDAFCAVGGYDGSFSHNEDAELDYRLGQAGYRIWLTAKTCVTYLPRNGVSALARQYFNFGRGRARNLLKHSARPNVRQAIMIGLGPALALASFAPLLPALALPALAWLSAALLGGAVLAVGHRDATLLLSGPVAILMHLSWTAGFWCQAIYALGTHPARVGP